MAIVGTAFVRLRVIGNTLGSEIGKQVKNSVKEASGDLDKAGESVGKKVGDKASESVSRSVAGSMDDIGRQIGERMAENMGRSLRRRVGTKISESLSGAKGFVKDGTNKLKSAFDEAGDVWGKATKNKFQGALKTLFAGGIAGAVTAAPSLLAFGGAVAGALVSTIVTGLASLGPVIAGAGLAGVAAFSSIKIAAGLVGLALKQQTPALDDYKKRLDAFKTTIATPIQAGLLSGLNAAMRIAQPIITQSKLELQDFGLAAGDVAINLADAFRQPAMIENVRVILANTTGMIREATPGVTGLAQAFAILLAHLQPITNFLGAAVGDLGQWALATIRAAEASGQLDAFITRMFDSLRFFVGILWDFGVGVANVFRAAFGASGGMLDTLQQLGQKFREWTSDQENQDRMTRFFANMRIITGEVLSIIKDLAQAAAGALEGTDVNSVVGGLQMLRDLGPPIAQMFRQIQQAAGPNLAEAFRAFIELITNLANSGVLGILTEAFTNFFKILSFILTIPGVGQLLTLVAGLAVLAKTAGLLLSVFRLLGPAFTIIRIVLVALAGVIGWVPIVIGVLVAALIWFFTQTEIGRHIIEVVWNAIKVAFQAAINAIVVALQWVWGVLQSVWDFIKTAAQGIWSAVSTAFQAVVTAVTTAWNTVWSVVSGVVNAVWGVITTVFNAIYGVISTVVNAYLTVVTFVFNAIWTVISTVLEVIWGIVSRIFQAIYAVIYAMVMAAYAIIMAIWNAIWGFLQPILQGIWDFIVSVWNGIYGAISAALGWIWNIITSIWNTIWGYLSGVLETIWNNVEMAWGRIFGVISDVLGSIWGAITNVWNSIWGYISGVYNTISGYTSQVWSSIFNAVSGVVSNIWTTITNAFNSVVNFIAGIPGTIAGYASKFLDAGKNLIQSIVDGIGQAASYVGGVAKNIVNSVIDFVNTHIIDGINNLLEFTVAGVTIDPPDIARIPRLAMGGVVSPTGGGTLALIAEAGRSERVEPLDSQGLSRRDRAIIDQLAGAGGGGDTTVIVKIGETELRGIVSTEVRRENDDMASALITGRKAS